MTEKVVWYLMFGVFRAVMFLWFTKDLNKTELRRTNQILAGLILIGSEMLRFAPVLSVGNVAVAVARQMVLFAGAFLAAGMLTEEGHAVNFYFGSIFTLCLGMWKNIASPFVLSTIGIAWFAETDSFSTATQLLIQMVGSAAVLYILKQYVLDFSIGWSIRWLQVVIGVFPSLINQLVMIVLYQSLYYDRVLIRYPQNGAIAGLFLLLPVSSLFSMVAAEHYRKQEVERDQIQQQQFQVQMVYHEMEVTRQKDEELRAFRHDIKRHMNTLQGMVMGGYDASEYINSVVQELLPMMAEATTGNGVLDVIIHQKKKICAEKHIGLQVCMNYEKSSFMEQMDICTIFSNAIDNAIEAIEKDFAEYGQSGHPTIQLQGGEIAHCLIGKITNPCRHPVHFQQGLPATTKQKKEAHGYGLKNIENMIRKYDGVLRVKVEQDVFFLSWTIPIPQDH